MVDLKSTGESHGGSNPSGRTLWCNSHQREALNEKGCDPKLAGILLICNVVDLTGIAEIYEE